MLITCKCLNLVVSTNSTTTIQQQQQNDDSNKDKNDIITQLYGINTDDLQKLQKSHRIYEECVRFFRQSSGPLNGLQENIVQKDLMCKVPINPWILYYCINCDTIAYAKHTSSNNMTTSYLINSTLLTNQEELNCLKNHQSFSDAFGILVIDRPQLSVATTTTPTTTAPAASITTSSLSSNNTLNIINKIKQNRFKNLTDILNKRLQKEIFETDERIRRYTEQQFALLKTFREKSEQEYQILVSLINQVPDDNIKMIDAIDNNVITTSTSTTNNDDDDNEIVVGKERTIKTKTTTIDTTVTDTTAAASDEKSKSDDHNNSSSVTLFSLKQQQILNLDTPPATPDNSTPMSVGNSPTFNRQQTNLFDVSNGGGDGDGKITTPTNANNISMNGSFDMMMMMMNGGVSSDADCLFELEGMEVAAPNSSGMNTEMSDAEETEDAEDALGELDLSSIQIPRSHFKKSSNLNIAKSLPISISNVPERRFYMNELDDEIPEDTTIDIAASIKALAKSVHGDTVFGDLPRPRFSTQI